LDLPVLVVLLQSREVLVAEVLVQQVLTLQRQLVLVQVQQLVLMQQVQVLV
jgi:hypothetical protein